MPNEVIRYGHDDVANVLRNFENARWKLQTKVARLRREKWQTIPEEETRVSMLQLYAQQITKEIIDETKAERQEMIGRRITLLAMFYEINGRLPDISLSEREWA